MKSMRKIATKIAGIAIATAMMAGSMAVFAADIGDEVYSSRLESTAYRDFYGASVASVIEQHADTDNWASRCAFYGVNV